MPYDVNRKHGIYCVYIYGLNSNKNNNEHRPLPRQIWQKSGVYPESGYGSGRWIQITIKFNGNFLVQSYICDEIFMKIRSVFPAIWAKLWRNAVLKIPPKIPDPEADHFQNLISSSLCTDTSVVKFPWSFYVKFLTDRQTVRHRALPNLLGGDNDKDNLYSIFL